MNKKFKYIYAITVIILVAATDYAKITGYTSRSLLKLLTFAIIPYALTSKKTNAKLITASASNKAGIILGALIAVIIVGTYFLIEKYFDFSNIAPQINAKYSITAGNFLPVAIYIALINSFIEEYFFRGFLFLTIKDKTVNKALISAALFTAYHLSLFDNWFNIPMLLMAIVGLFISAMIFNALAQRSQNLLSSYALHMGANIGINIVGYILMLK